jgi:hypothetical protein
MNMASTAEELFNFAHAAEFELLGYFQQSDLDVMKNNLFANNHMARGRLQSISHAFWHGIRLNLFGPSPSQLSASSNFQEILKKATTRFITKTTSLLGRMCAKKH